MKQPNFLLALLIASASTLFAYDGPTFSASVWRGESACVRVPDNLAGDLFQACRNQRFKVTEGVEIVLAGLETTRYATHAHSAQFLYRADHIVPVIGTKSAIDSAPPSLCRVKVAQDAKPGLYQVGPLELHVIDRVLPAPKDWKYFLDLWQHPWAVARFFRCEPFSPAHFERMEPVWQALAECGVKCLTTTLLDMPWNHQCYDAYHSMIGRVKKSDGSWSFDYALFDRYVEFGRKCGIGPSIACYTMCPWGYVVRWKDEKGTVCHAMAKPGSREFDDFWGAFLPDFAAHLKAKGWFSDTYIAMDERSPEDVRFIVDYVHKKAPGLKIAMAGNRKPSDFNGIEIDCYSQVLSDVSDAYLAELSKRREKGQITTFYVCCGPARPNTFMSSSDDEGFWLGAYPALSGFDGFLRWAANSWPHNPYQDASFGNWAPGDTFLVYPDGSPSARLDALRAGVVAAEKVRVLNADGSLNNALKDLAAKYGYDKAIAGSINHSAFRRDMEALVNRK